MRLSLRRRRPPGPERPWPELRRRRRDYAAYRPVGQGQQGEQRPGVGIGGSAGQDLPERLAEHPDDGGCRDGQDQGSPGGRARQVHAHAHDRQGDGQHDRGGQPLVGDERGSPAVQHGQPPGLAIRHPRDHVVQRLRCLVRGQQREVGQAEPQHKPQRPRHGGADRARRDERRGPGGRTTVGRPQQHREQRVEDHGAGRAADRIHVAGQHHTESLAEPPHAQRPGHRGGQRHPYRGPPGDPDPQQQLDRGEDRVQQHQMMPDERGVPADRPGHDTRVPGRRIRQHVAEPLGEHERLVLQHAVEQPQPGQRQLQQPPDVGRCPPRLGLRARRAPPRGTDAPGGDLAHPALLGLTLFPENSRCGNSGK